jgi:transposase
MAVTVLSGPERRRRWTSAEKLGIVEESLAPEASVAEVARRHDVHPNLIHAWRRQTRTGTLVTGRDPVMAADSGCRFAPVVIASGRGAMGPTRSDAGVGPVIEVVLRNGRVLRLPEGVAPARAVALADALDGPER